MKHILLILLSVFLFCSPARAEDLETDKARYAPGEEVMLRIPGASAARVILRFLNEEPLLVHEGPVENETVRFACPDTPYRGYLIEAETDIGILQTALDVSPDPLRFPRYGYVWDFTPGVNAEKKIRAMNRYHIDLVQYYDWQYRHHIPLAENLNGWSDWSGRRIDGNAVRSYLEAAHERNMANMAYNMMYAANRSYLTDGSGVDPAWCLVKYVGGYFAFTMSENRGDVGVLQFMNPLSEGWQAYIFGQMRKVFAALPFDGWHADTIGEYGGMTTADGEPLGYKEDGAPIHLVKDTYTAFISAEKAALPDQYLAFNPVGAQGIENVCASDADILYAEFWPGDKNTDGQYYITYDVIQKQIFDAAALSGGKSLVVAGYINYKAPGVHFNAPAVLLLDAVCYASGGARIELGNGSNMLSNEYFPGDKAMTMDDDLRAQVTRMYDFITAYENVLRDGQTPTDCSVEIEGTEVSGNGKKRTVWAFAMEDGRRTICHFINLLGTDNSWRDDRQTKAVPEKLENLTVKWYGAEGTALWLASPDGEDLAPRTVPFTRGEDASGAYITFKVPSLEYWDLLCLER